MSEFAFVVLGRLDQVTGGYLFDRRLIEELRDAGRRVRVIELDPAGADAALAALPDGMLTVVDGLTLPALGETAAAAAGRLRVVGFVHHPLADETALPAAEVRRLARLEAAILPLLHGVVCPSRRTASAVAAYGVARERIAVTPPGLDKPACTRQRRGPVRRLLCVGNIIPRKGYEVLVEALARIADLDWTLTCVGSLERDAETTRSLRRQVSASGLGGRIVLIGEQRGESVAAAFEAADAFVLASHHEGYGMVCAEAMAHGLPQVTTAAGAIPEVVPPEAGLLVAPGDAAAFARSLRRLITEPGLAARLSTAALTAAKRLPSWPEAALGWGMAVVKLAASPRHDGIPPRGGPLYNLRRGDAERGARE
jgi:glycosyltransferase involved in cell wall biosynthesis